MAFGSSLIYQSTACFAYVGPARLAATQNLEIPTIDALRAVSCELVCVAVCAHTCHVRKGRVGAGERFLAHARVNRHRIHLQLLIVYEHWT